MLRRPAPQSPVAKFPWLSPRFAQASSPRILAPTIPPQLQEKQIPGRPLPQACARLSTKDGTSIYVDYFSVDEGCQVRCGKKDGTCNFFRRRHALQCDGSQGRLHSGFFM